MQHAAIAGIVPADFEKAVGEHGVTLRLTGDWVIAGIADADQRLRELTAPERGAATLDLAAVAQMDTAGAWLVFRTRRQLSFGEAEAAVVNAKPRHQALLDVITGRRCQIEPPRVNAFIHLLSRIGQGVAAPLYEMTQLLNFMGLIFTTWLRTLINPWRLRVTPLVHHMEQAGLDAAPIVALMSFLIGGVLAFLGADILRQFGAEVFVVNLIVFSFLREFGVLLAAIMVAGRSGSAFTAQIGAMKGHEEIDAMKTLSLDPVEMLVLPRVLALVICLPVLAFIGDVMGLFGGGLVAWFALDISPSMYLARLQEAAELRHLLAGLIKAPVFAFIIAMIGCYQGMMVSGSAESVGQRTTRSVVQAIFMVIVADAFFALFFLEMGI